LTENGETKNGGPKKTIEDNYKLSEGGK